MKAFEVSKTSVPITTDYKYSTAGTYTITVPIAGDYEFELIGGGGPASINNTYYQQGLVGLATGGSGAYFKGVYSLSAGTYSLLVDDLAGDNVATVLYNPSGSQMVWVGQGSTPGGGTISFPNGYYPKEGYTALSGNSGVRRDSVATNYGIQSGGTGWTVDGHVYGQGQGTALTAGPDLSHYMLKKSGGSGGYARVTLTTSFIDKYVLNAFNHEYTSTTYGKMKLIQ